MNLTPDNYYSQEANKEYWSVSQIKSFLDCPVKALAEMEGTYQRPSSTALLVGGFVDAYFAGEMEEFQEKNPQIFTRKGDLRYDYQHAQKIIDRIERDRLCVDMLDGEKQHIVTGNIAGFPVKAKLDVLLSEKKANAIGMIYPEMSELLFAPGAIVDLKIMRDFNDQYREGEGRLNWIEFWMYDLQMAVYQELMRQKTGKRYPCYILAATKEEIPDITLYQIPQGLMDASLEILIDRMPSLNAVKKRIEAPEPCGKCPVCKERKVLSGATWFEE